MACPAVEKNEVNGQRAPDRKKVIREWNVWCVSSGPSSRHQDKGHCAAVVLRGHLRKTKKKERKEPSCLKAEV